MVTEKDLKAGEAVYLSRHGSGSLCLLVKRDELVHIVHRDDGLVRLFDGRGEVEFYCRIKGFNLREEYERSVVREKHLLPSGSTSEEPEVPLPPLDPEWSETFVEAIKKQASRDLERLVSLTDKRERLLKELVVKLHRRLARGNKSCLCHTCLHVLESPVKEVQAEIDKIWAWWADSLETTPPYVCAGRWP